MRSLTNSRTDACFITEVAAGVRSTKTSIMKKTLTSLLIGAACVAASIVQAQISVGPSGAGPLTFDTTPLVTEFSSFVLQGTAPTLVDAAGVDAAVALLTVTAIDPAAAAQALPPGLLLTLVENAVEHGVCASLHGAEVVLDARRDGQTVRISVRDSAALWNSASAEGVGLRNRSGDRDCKQDRERNERSAPEAARQGRAHVVPSYCHVSLRRTEPSKPPNSTVRASATS